MSVLDTEPLVGSTLTAEDYGKGHELKTGSADLILVNGAADKAEQFVIAKQWNLMWRDADLLYQSPRPLTVQENTYVLEPNVQRFTVAKVCASVVPQLYKGLFYTDPPMLLRPRPGTSQNVIDAKSALISYLLDECRFKSETKWGLEGMTLLGTGIWKWGIDYKKIITKKRVPQQATLTSGTDQTQDTEKVALDVPPKIEKKETIRPRPFFEYRPLSAILVDPKCAVGDIRAADFVIDQRQMDFYAFDNIRQALAELPKDSPDLEGWELPLDKEELKKWWTSGSEAENVAPVPDTENSELANGAVHHAEQVSVQVTPDLLFKKLEVLEYWDRNRKILVVARKFVAFSGKNPFDAIPFLSANWMNRPKSFYGMGVGLLVGQNQRVDQGTINAILKMLSFGVNPVYLRKRDTNATGQMIRTGLGKIVSVDGEIDKSFRLLETPRVPGEVWSALSESEKATESSTGADSMLVQGSTSGPRSSMGRTAGGAATLAGASATRLDGPLDNFIEQVFKPFMYILDDLILTYLSDKDIQDILSDELGKAYNDDLDEFHSAKVEYEVLAGASLAAKRTMAQSMTLITQILENPSIQQNLAEINEEYIDFKPIVKMWLESSEWKNQDDIIKPMTDAMKQKRQAESQAAQQQSKAAIATQTNDQKFQQKQQLEDQASNNRIKRDIAREAFKVNATSEAVSGTPNPQGVQGDLPTIA